MKHPIVDKDVIFKIDPVTMAITCEGDVKALRCGEHAAERFSFMMPRYIEGHDMSLCNKVEVHYDNIKYDKNTRETTTNSSFDEVDDFRVSDNGEDVEWSWLIKGDATELDGTLNFCMRFACVEGDTIEFQRFSEIYEGVVVGKTIYNTGSVAKAYSDVLESWRDELLTAIENTTGAVKTINGANPDENGNIEIGWNNLADKPFESVSELVEAVIAEIPEAEGDSF